MSGIIPVTLPQFFEDDYCSGQFTFYNAGDLYFVTLNEVGLTEANFNLSIFKLPAGESAWTRIVDDADRGCTTPIAACQQGSVIYIFVKSPNGPYGVNVNLFRYDMAVDAFLADDVSGPNSGGSRPFQCVPLNDGRIFLSNVDGWYLWESFAFWTSVTPWTFAGDPPPVAVPVSVTHDPATDRVFVALSTGNLEFVTVDPGSGQNTKELVKAGTFRDGVDIGWPAMLGDQVNLPVWYNFTSLLVERGTTDAIPAFVEEAIDISGLAADVEPSTFSAFSYPIAYALTVGETLYVFFGANIVDAFHHNLYTSAARGWLYETHTTQAVGGWSTPAAVFTGAGPTAIASAYPVTIDAERYGIVYGVFDPVVFISPGEKYLSLAVYGGAPASPPVIEPDSPPDGSVGSEYSYQFGVQDGTGEAPFTWSNTGDDVPGLTLDASTGLFSGTPTTAGSYTLGITVTDANGNTDTVTPTIVISAQSAGNIRVTMRGIRRFAAPRCDEEARRPEPAMPPVKRVL